MKRVLNFSLPLIIILFPAIFLSFSITPIYAADITLSWNANTEPDLAGYRIYRKIQSDPADPNVDYIPIDDKCLTDFEDSNNPTYDDSNLDSNNIYYFVVTAYDTSGLESDYSNEVSIELNTYYLDSDSDGYGNAHNTVEASSTPSGYVNNSSDCDDGNSSIYPGAVEICNGLDDDCDGSIDEGVLSTYFKDTDGDGYGNAQNTVGACSAPSGYVNNSIDCDDGNSSIYPGADEIINGLDDDCDGSIDEGVLNTYYLDSDGDGYGDAQNTVEAYSAPSGYVNNSSDFDDGDSSIHPGADEICGDEIDNNCNGDIDENCQLDPNINLPEVIPPRVKKINPQDKAESIDGIYIPINTSFCALFEDFDGIDITDVNSIKFTITDGHYPPYERDLSDTNVVRVVKIYPEESNAQVTELWVIYDRSRENDDELKFFEYDQNVNIKIDAKDIGQNWMEQASYDFEIESEEEHNNSLANLPEFEPLVNDDPALTELYNEGIQIVGGDLDGAKIVYNSAEVVTPTFGPINELPPLIISNEISDEAIGTPMALQPPTVFSTPVKIFIPCPGQLDVSELSLYFYDGTNYVIACNADGQVQPGGEDWMVPDSRVNHNDDEPATIEIKVHYFFGGVQAQRALPKNLLPPGQSNNITDSSGAGGGGCFINSL